MSSKKVLEKKFAKYCFQILESKFLYYEGAEHNLSPYLEDQDYDELEVKYRKLAVKLGHKPKLLKMVGFSDKTCSAKMVKQHMLATKGRKNGGDILKSGKAIKEVVEKADAIPKMLKKILKDNKVKDIKIKKIIKEVKKELNPNRRK